MNLSSLSPFLRNSFLRNLTRDGLLAMEPERAHQATIMALKLGLAPSQKFRDAPELKTILAGLELANPIGMAAGFDKNAEVHTALGTIGFGLTEVGTLTPRAQRGNKKPRLFRLMGARGVINRMGFNNEGHAPAYERLRLQGSRAMVGVNIGANKDTEDFVADYVLGVERFSDIADYLTINISSPNTPGLRDLQSGELLNRLLSSVLSARARQKVRVPVFLKLAPDLDQSQMDEICASISGTGLDGLIISNTTLARETVAGFPGADEAGGLSGIPLFDLSTRCLAQMRQRVGPDLPIIGVGGVHSAQSALDKFEAGANAIQLYTALVFEGMDLLEEIKAGLIEAVRARKQKTVADLVGSRVDEWASKLI